jgi:hypothetical protein
VLRGDEVAADDQLARRAQDPERDAAARGVQVPADLQRVARERGVVGLEAALDARQPVEVADVELDAGAVGIEPPGTVSGTLRADFSPEDLVLLLMATAGIVSRTGATAPAATDRFVALALDGLRAQAATPAPPPISPRTMISRLREIARAS